MLYTVLSKKTLIEIPKDAGIHIFHLMDFELNCRKNKQFPKLKIDK
jgi:hypothetical protein